MKATIFIVEDEPSILELVKHNLEKANFKVFFYQWRRRPKRNKKKRARSDFIRLDASRFIRY